MPRAILLRNPRALLIPEVAMLIKRAVEATKYAAPGGIDTVAKDFFDYTTDESMFLFLGMEDGAPKGLEMGYFSDSNLFPLPMLSLIYNEGSKALLKVMLEATVDHLTAHGHSKFVITNATGYSDKAWLRKITPKGTTGRLIAHVFEVAIK